MRPTLRRAAALAAIPFLGGCFAYVPIEPSAVSPGTTVRVQLDREEAVRQIDALGGLRERLEGRVAEQTTAGALALTVRQAATPAAGGRFNAFLTLPWKHVARVERKDFSPLRTAAVAAGAGVVAAVALAVLEGSSRPGEGEGPGVEEAIRIPLLRLRW